MHYGIAEDRNLKHCTVAAQPLAFLCRVACRCREVQCVSENHGRKWEIPGEKTRETARLARERERQVAKKLPKLWNIMDSLVIGLLNDHQTAERIQKSLSKLSGYRPSQSVRKAIIGNAAFSCGTDREHPNYWITTIRLNGSLHLLGVYNDVLFHGQSMSNRLSVYTRKRLRWMKTDSIESKRSLSVYYLPSFHQGEVLMTIEQYVGADHIDGDFKFWKLQASGKLILLSRYDRLLDYSVYQKPGRLTVTYSKFPKYLDQPFLGIRIRYSLDVSFDNHVFKHHVACLNPWVETLDNYFGCIQRNDDREAKGYLMDSELLSQLKKPIRISQEHGDVDSGRAVIEMHDQQSQVHLSIIFQRSKDNRWLITDVLRR
ncbi:MAG: hypothetical protein ACP5SH_19260 [Syntrophobacteraceae bacterium]